MHESCAPLLQEFHRTVEVDGVPEWQPGLVSSVCLAAEGTTQFIKLGEIAAALLVEKLVPSWPIVHPANYVPKRDGSACTGSFGTCAVAVTGSPIHPGYPDAFWGWYDVDRCGSCNHYCRWVGNSGSGGDPSVKTTYGESYWACETADAFYIRHSTFKYQKCGSKEEKSTAEVFTCPISSSNAANTNKFNHAIVIRGVNGCTVQADSIDAWADSNRLIFSITDKTSSQQVNDCLAPFTEFKVRSESILKRTASTYVGVNCEQRKRDI